MRLSHRRYINILDCKLSVRSYQVLGTLFVEGKALNIKVVFDVCFWEHGNILKLQKDAVIFGILIGILTLAAHNEAAIEQNVSNLQSIQNRFEVLAVGIF